MTLARAANRAWDPEDTFWFDLISLSGREQDRAIRNMTDEQVEAVSVLSTTTPTPERAAS